MCSDESTGAGQYPAKPPLTKWQKKITDRGYMIASLLVSMQVTNKTATVTWLRDVANYGILQEYPMKNYKGERQYINGQNAADRHAYQYGGAKMGAVGCELIATYNALLALGIPCRLRI